MKTMLSQISKGVVKKPHKILIYGTDGVGKTTFGSQAPKAIFLGPEGGSDDLDVARFPKINSVAEAKQAVRELIEAKHDYQTLVIDSVDWLEIQLFKDICIEHKVKTIERADGGYGKGYVQAFNWWSEFTSLLDDLRDTRKMNIILIGHSDIITFNDPNTQSTYERYQVKLHKKSSALLREWVDCVFFANFKVITKKDDKNDKKSRAFGDGLRVMYTERRPGFDAKNRKGLPEELELSWTAYEAALQVSRPDAANLVNQINEMIKELTDQELVEKIKETVEKSKEHVPTLEAIINRIRIRLEEV